MANEKRRLTIGNDDWQEIRRAASEVSVFSGTCDEDEPLATISIGNATFHCLPGDVLVEYDDGTWGVVEKPTRQSRLMSAMAARLS